MIFDEQISRKKNKLDYFIEKSITTHGDKYDYSKVIYKNNHTKVEIICKKHGSFNQKPSHHTNGRGCSKCGRELCSLKLSKTLPEDEVKKLSSLVNENTIKNLENMLGMCDTTIRKIMKKNGVDWKSSCYGNLHEDIANFFWYRVKFQAKKRNLEFNITPEYIWDLYIKQNKKCALSGIQINFSKNKKDSGTASIDRIDNDKGYIIDNIQLVHKTINKMKSDLDQDIFISFCKAVGGNF